MKPKLQPAKGSKTRMDVTAREFQPQDAAFCFRCRASAYVRDFYAELGPEVVADCVNAYLPIDYVRMADEMPFFVIENGNEPAGFFTIKRAGALVAEIPLIYLHRDHRGMGLGTWSVKFILNWVRTNWPEVSTLVVDTIIPEYNGGFYQKVGFARAGETTCEFPGRSVAAVRFERRLEPADRGDG